MNDSGANSSVSEPSTIKVLLYEPGKTGHRPTILGYTQKCLDSNGISYTTVTEKVPEKDEFEHLSQRALESNCNLIHYLTADGCATRWLINTVVKRQARPRVPLICNYYLYNNLFEVRGRLGWEVLFRTGVVRKVLISKPFSESEPTYPINSSIQYLPDPWDEKVFVKIDKGLARQKLNLPLDRVILLVFGELDERKSLKLIVDALTLSNADLMVLFVGRLAASTSSELRSRLEMLESQGKAKLMLHYISEDLVGTIFSAVDGVICAYPKSFLVSSGTFTRACAFGLPVIGTSHGFVGSMISRWKCGLVFRANDEKTLEQALNNFQIFLTLWRQVPGQVAYSQSARLGKYSSRLLAVYRTSGGSDQV